MVTVIIVCVIFLVAHSFFDIRAVYLLNKKLSTLKERVDRISNTMSRISKSHNRLENKVNIESRCTINSIEALREEISNIWGIENPGIPYGYDEIPEENYGVDEGMTIEEMIERDRSENLTE